MDETLAKPETIEILGQLMINTIDYINSLSSAFVKIYLIGFVTMNLVTAVRYPDIENYLDPIKTFTVEHPMIKLQPELQQIASTAFEELVLLMEESKT